MTSKMTANTTTALSLPSPRSELPCAESRCSRMPARYKRFISRSLFYRRDSRYKRHCPVTLPHNANTWVRECRELGAEDVLGKETVSKRAQKSLFRWPACHNTRRHPSRLLVRAGCSAWWRALLL